MDIFIVRVTAGPSLGQRPNYHPAETRRLRNRKFVVQFWVLAAQQGDQDSVHLPSRRWLTLKVLNF